MFKSKAFLWILAVIITLLAAYYQKTTGPTYPKKETISINGQEHVIKLIRSSSLDTIANVFLNIPDKEVTAELYYRRYPSNNTWVIVKFKEFENGLTAFLPNLDAAGKWEYYVKISSGNEVVNIGKEEKIVIRYKGAVPATILIPHILFIFTGMLIANFTGLLVLFGKEKYKFYILLTFILLTLGGMIFGPIVQKYAFGEYWTGIPFGWDLTDNKMLIAFLVWMAAYLGNIKKDRAYLAIIATIIILIIFSIPHSMFGSELDPVTGEIISA